MFCLCEEEFLITPSPVDVSADLVYYLVYYFYKKLREITRKY